MWIAKIKLQHDCIIGNRCKKFGILLQSYDLNEQISGKKVLTSSLHQLIGEKEKIHAFVSDLKKDKRTEYIEVNENTLFLIESTQNKPVSSFTKQMFFVKPVVVDTNGFEHWEIASHKKEELMKFITTVKPLCSSFSLLALKNTKLKDIYFPKVLPALTDLQKKALELAIAHKYYSVPKGIGLRQLATYMHLSLATYQKHLQKAEAKIVPDILSYLK